MTPKQEVRMDLELQRDGSMVPYPIRTFSNSIPIAAGQSSEK